MNLADWLEHHLLRCPYKSFFGLDCPGCGMQRAFVALLRGDIKESFFLYPALLPVMLTLMLTLVHISFKLKEGARYIKYSYLISVVLIVISYIIKLVR
jgi:uncharacterized protein DUF2752